MAYVTVTKQRMILFSLGAVSFTSCSQFTCLVIDGTGVSVFISNGSIFRSFRRFALYLANVFCDLFTRQLPLVCCFIFRRQANSGRDVVQRCAISMIVTFWYVNYFVAFGRIGRCFACVISPKDLVRGVVGDQFIRSRKSDICFAFLNRNGCSVFGRYTTVAVRTRTRERAATNCLAVTFRVF